MFTKLRRLFRTMVYLTQRGGQKSPPLHSYSPKAHMFNAHQNFSQRTAAKGSREFSGNPAGVGAGIAAGIAAGIRGNPRESAGIRRNPTIYLGRGLGNARANGRQNAQKFPWPGLERFWASPVSFCESVPRTGAARETHFANRCLGAVVYDTSKSEEKKLNTT